ncbi:MAG: hypothetical protein CVV30_05155 [Methanomicrobiales archaeon HGW-Methanomicrobiales-1]|jgi:hypothetical protein|nr:MAG: hypothetical protein CVV30_05155 [Methanomicrobiales archaeon HGW-Methanomicrobiales-1]
MAPPFLTPYLNKWTIGVVLLAILAIIVLLSVLGIPPTSSCPVTVCSTDCTIPVTGPLFPGPVEKITALKDPAFSRQLFAEAIATEPLLAVPGTQVHMGFWSGKGNHGSMLRVLDAINEGPAASAVPPNRAIWDEGTTAYYNYPSYTRILDEHWYERASGVNGTVIIFGKSYADPQPVTFAEADEVWGQYSARYTDMAELIAQATGKPVKVWCFVQGARANRIFYTYELPQLQQMEQKGYVQVYFAKIPDADWTKPEDWINGTTNIPAPAP